MVCVCPANNDCKIPIHSKTRTGIKTRSPEGDRREAEGPIGIYRDQWEALENKRKLACFCSPGLRTNLLGDLLESALLGDVMERLLEIPMSLSASVCVGLR